tara:strand:- start:527 stop:1156 length:630 start_codon:yes stop_codon:yes gene_type:complete
MFHPVLNQIYRLYHKGMVYVNHNHVYKFKDYSECIFETQIQSKNWLGERLRGVVEHNKIDIQEIDIAASWYGIVIVPFLKYYLGTHIKFNLYDVDWYTTEIASHIFDDDDLVTVKTNDVVFDDIDFTGDTFINCSCEHMFDMKELTSMNTDKKVFAFQSNDNRNVQWMHINCVDTPEELAKQAGLKRIYDTGVREILRNKRIMVIGAMQ